MEYYKNLSLENIEGEIWKDIPGCEGIYQVSNTGRVKSVLRTYINSNGHIRTVKDRIICQVINRLGYPMTALGSHPKRKTFSIHRLVTRAFIGESTLKVDHLNGIKTDNRLENLEYVTQRENSKRYHIGKRDLPIGVIRENGKYAAQINIRNNHYYLGSYFSIKEASNAYNSAASDPDNIEKYRRVKKKSSYGNGISLVGEKFMVRFMRDRKWVYLGRFSDLNEAQKVSSDYLNSSVCL